MVQSTTLFVIEISLEFFMFVPSFESYNNILAFPEITSTKIKLEVPHDKIGFDKEFKDE